MNKIVEIDYWKLLPGNKERSVELVRNFAKFASNNLEAVFDFGIVKSGKHLDNVSFFFMWFSRLDYEKWNDDCEINKEFQNWLAIVEDSGEKHKMVDYDVIEMGS